MAQVVHLNRANKRGVDIGYAYNFAMTLTSKGSPTNLTGSTFNMKVKKKKSEDTYLFELTNVEDLVTSGFYMPEPRKGIVYLQIMSTDTNITKGSYPYELYRTDPSGNSWLYMQGLIEFVEGAL